MTFYFSLCFLSKGERKLPFSSWCFSIFSAEDVKLTRRRKKPILCIIVICVLECKSRTKYFLQTTPNDCCYQ